MSETGNSHSSNAVETREVLRMRKTTVVCLYLCLSWLGMSGCDQTEAEFREKERIRIEQEQAILKKEAPANFAMAKASLEQGDLAMAEEFLNKVAKTDLHYPGLDVLGADLQKAKERAEKEERERQAEERAVAAREEVAANRAKRADLQGVLRESFLDRGLDIKVRVTGKNHDRLKLTYVLFNDVWSHRMQKEGLISQWCSMGFQRIDLTDGYDWGVYWNCN
jgi:hypothetical protein